ncbi:kinase-like domain-containing protein [Nemania sp. FL0031]|nr:kinase-like domain-containing protein [Nemania sp. FL0031]
MRQIAHWLRQPLKRYSSIPTQSTPNAHEASEEPLHVGETVTSDSGQTYRIEEILKEYRRPLMCVYRASSQGKPYLLKNPVPRAFERYKELIESLASAPHIRPLVDSITPLKIFVYPFLDGHLLDFAKKNLSPNTRRNISPDIKPDNVCINYRENGEEEPTITDVQIGDLEDAAHFTERGGIKGCVCGNHLWRSPESWAAAHQSTPSDIFSFGLFGMLGLVDYLGRDNIFSSRLVGLLDTFDTPSTRMQPIFAWTYGDVDFRDLVSKMTNLDPRRRITAREALKHPWFTKEL